MFVTNDAPEKIKEIKIVSLIEVGNKSREFKPDGFLFTHSHFVTQRLR